jgi:5-methylthioadenosine/S-adenosylhomocysteine deaminase
MGNKELKKADLILTHGYILTMNSKREILRDGAIAVKGDEIIDIGPTKEILDGYVSENIKDLKGVLVHPGLIDAHAHTGMHLIRSLCPDTMEADEMFEKFEVAYFNKVTAEDEYYGTVLACMEMVLNGTTAFGDTGSATVADVDSIIEAVNLVGMRGRTGHFIIDQSIFNANLNMPTDKCLELLEYQLRKFPFKPGTMVSCWVTMMGMGECTDKLFTEGRNLADKYNTCINMHQACVRTEVEQYIKKNNGVLPIIHYDKLGLLSPRTSLVHMIHLTPVEIEVIKRTGTGVIHCPGASTRNVLGSSIYGSFPEMVEKGIPIALGSDQGNSSDAFDICRMAYLAAIIHKEARGIAPAISAEQAFEMATITGARVMGMDDIIGSLEAGKKADIVIHNLNHPGSHPPIDMLNNLIFSIHSKSVDTVLINGKVIVERGELKTLNSFEMLKEIDKRALDLAKRMGFKVVKTWPII